MTYFGKQKIAKNKKMNIHYVFFNDGNVLRSNRRDSSPVPEYISFAVKTKTK